MTTTTGKVFQGDAKLFQNFTKNIIDIGITTDYRDAIQDVGGFNAATQISLFSDGRAKETDTDRTDKRGWIGEEILTNIEGKPIIFGSRLWLLEGNKRDSANLSKMNEYSYEALKWYVDFNICSKVLVSCNYLSSDLELAEISTTFVRPKDENLNFKYFYNWELRNYEVNEQ